MAVSTALLFGAGLAIESYRALASVDTGFDAQGVTTFELRLPSVRYVDGPAVRGFYDELTARLAALPAVVSAGAIDKRPLGSRWGCMAWLSSDRPMPATRNDWPCAEVQSVTAGYFDAMGIRVLEGRGITAADRAESAPVAVVSASLAREHWPGRSPLGESLKWANELETEGGWRTIVGVVEDITHVGLDRGASPTAYVSFAQSPDRRMTVAVRTGGDPGSLTGPIRSVVAALDEALPLRDFLPMTDVVEARLSTQLTASAFLGLTAAAGLILALAGVYGVLACRVSDRIREIGLRMALGETRSSLVRSVVAQGLQIAVEALALGLLAAFFLGRALSSLFFGVAPFEPSIVLASIVLVVLVATLASYVPARRAASIDPVAALRAS
jgi:predicted permease